MTAARPLALPGPSARHALFWLGLFVLFLVIVRVLGSVLTPFVVGAAIAYFLNPVCESLVRRGWPRWGAALLVLGLFGVCALAFVLMVGPLVATQMAHFLQQLPTLIDRARTEVEPLLHRLLGSTPDTTSFTNLRALTSQYAGQAAQIAGGVLGKIWQGGTALVSVVSLIVVVPVVAYYLMRDWPLLVSKIDSWLPRAQAPVIRQEVRKVDRTLAGFLRGQATVCLILGVYYAVALSLVGLNFGLFIGLVAGLLSFIPFVGSSFGLVCSVIMALIQFDSYSPVAFVVGIFLVAQFVEGNFLTPRLVGESVGLHPVWIIFALMTGGSLLGFVGLLLAVPVAAVLGVVIRFALGRYLTSGYYAARAKRRVLPLKPL